MGTPTLPRGGGGKWEATFLPCQPREVTDIISDSLTYRIVPGALFIYSSSPFPPSEEPVATPMGGGDRSHLSRRGDPFCAGESPPPPAEELPVHLRREQIDNEEGPSSTNQIHIHVEQKKRTIFFSSFYFFVLTKWRIFHSPLSPINFGNRAITTSPNFRCSKRPFKARLSKFSN